MRLVALAAVLLGLSAGAALSSGQGPSSAAGPSAGTGRSSQAGPARDASVLPVTPRRWVSIFYYTWYGTGARDGTFAHWNQDGRSAPLDIASNFYPARGIYSSADPKIVDVHMDDIAAAGVGEIAVSWWGWGSAEDARLPRVVRAAHRHGIAVAIHLEPYEGRSLATLEQDVRHLYRAFGVTRYYMYDPFQVPVEDWAALRKRIDDLPVQLFAQTASVGRAVRGAFEGVYTYDILGYPAAIFARLCTQAHAAGLLCAPSVGPGWKAERATGDTREKPRNDGRTYDSMWRGAIQARADAVTITSYNEWHEGTQIEPARAAPPKQTASASAYSSYDGAYGQRGASAGTAYLDRTAYWLARFLGTR